MKHVFKLRRANPENQKDAGKMFETMVNKVTYRNFVKITKTGMNWNTEDVKTHLALNKFKNTRVLGFHPLVVSKFGLIPNEVPQGTHTADLDEDIGA